MRRNCSMNWTHKIFSWKYLTICQFFPEHRLPRFWSPPWIPFRGCWWSAAAEAHALVPVLYHLRELAQTHVHQVSDAIQPSHPLSSPSPFAFYLPQHQGLFQSQLFTSGGQSSGASASASVLPMNIQDWFPLGLTSLSSQTGPMPYANHTWKEGEQKLSKASLQKVPISLKI